MLSEVRWLDAKHCQSGSVLILISVEDAFWEGNKATDWTPAPEVLILISVEDAFWALRKC
jgi:hypothetical protein